MNASAPVVVLTGATGFIGRHLIWVLASSGYRVRAVVRSAFGASLPPETEVREIADLVTVDWLDVLAGADAVLHLAGMAHRSAPRSSAERELVQSVNVEAVGRMTKGAVAAGLRRLVLMSSVGVLGATSGEGAFHCGSIPAPHDFYSWTKLEAEKVARAASGRALELSIVRPPLVFGPNAPGNFGRLTRYIRKGVPLPFGAINNSRSMVSVWNLCDFLLACLDRPGAIGAPLLVADRETVSTPELVRLCQDVLNTPAALIKIPIPILRLGARILGRGPEIERLSGSLVVDTGESEARMDWSPSLTLREGLRRSLMQNELEQPSSKPA